jgi:putative chitinase
MSDAYKQAMAEAARNYADAVAEAAKLEEPSAEKKPPPTPDSTPPEEKQGQFNSAALFDEIRTSLFGGSLNQGQVDGMNVIGMACSIAGLNPVLEQSAYILATAYHETAQTMQPIEEYGGWNTTYAPWFGRGFVQLTWEENYEKQQNKLDAIPQVHTYEIPYQVHDDYNLALDPRTSAIITVGGMRDGDFTGKKLSDYIKPGSVDYVNARRIVNGTDRAEQIAGYAEKYEEALRAGMAG